MKKIFTYGGILVLIFLLFLFQVLIIDTRNLFGVKPNIILVSCIVASLCYGMYKGAFYSFFIGLLTDLLFGNSNGLFTLSYSITGVIVGYLNSDFNKDNIFSIAYITIYTTAIFEFVEYISYLFYTSSYSNFIYFIEQVFIESILNVVFAFIVYGIVYKIISRLDDNSFRSTF